MDLGGVDVGPDHREPVKGDDMAGLYEHKRSFGATWVEMLGAHERVDPALAVRGRPGHDAGGAAPRDDERPSCDARRPAASRPRHAPRRGRPAARGARGRPGGRGRHRGQRSRRRRDPRRDAGLSLGGARLALRGHPGPARRWPRLRRRGGRRRCGGRSSSSARSPGWTSRSSWSTPPARSWPAPPPGGTTIRRARSPSSGSPAPTARPPRPTSPWRPWRRPDGGPA